MPFSKFTARMEAAATLMFDRNWHIVGAALIYLPFIFMGYGEQPDAYVVVQTGERWLESGVYLPSRRPGSIVYEFSQAWLNRIGGSVLSNFGTLFMSLVVIACFTRLLKHFQIPMAKYLVLGLILGPMYWNNSTVSMDYLWALAFSLLGFTTALEKRFWIGGIFWGLALGSRLPSILTIMPLFLVVFLENPDDRKSTAKLMFMTAAIGSLCFVPSFYSAGQTFQFLNVDVNVGDSSMWTLPLRLGRFAYKNIYAWGLPAFLVLLISLFIGLRNWRLFRDRRWASLSVGAVTLIGLYEAFFYRYPMKIEYLLPIVPFVLFLLGIGLQNSPKVVALFVVSLASYNILNINIARPNLRWRATAAQFGARVEAGLLVQNVRERLLYRDCSDIICVANANGELIKQIQRRDGAGNILY